MKKLKKKALFAFDMSLLAAFCGKVSFKVALKLLELTVNRFEHKLQQVHKRRRQT